MDVFEEATYWRHNVYIEYSSSLSSVSISYRDKDSFVL